MMDPQEISKLSASAQADQSTAAVVNVAGDVAAYRARLIIDRVPRQLADQLTMQCAAYLLQSLVGGCGCGDGEG